MDKPGEGKPLLIEADFNGLFGDLLCISHGDTCLDEQGRPVVLREGMKLTAFCDDSNSLGEPDRLLASGVAERSPKGLRHLGSRWVLRIDGKGVYHESERREKG